MKWVGFSALVISMALIAGCFKSGSEDAGEDPVVRNGGVASIHITGNDDMRYNITSFVVHPGEKVRITFENVGKMPITTMGHDLVILKLGQDYKNFANEVSAADLQAKGEIADSLLDKVIAHTKILGPGESQTIELIAPSAGTYDYLCTFPTHAVFMHGRMIVKS
ncbi:MAG: Azurin [Phycisphaerales bacterium]|jgi:azurin|nr:Azurin [Phycisphaerales bacterium]